MFFNIETRWFLDIQKVQRSSCAKDQRGHFPFLKEVFFPRRLIRSYFHRIPSGSSSSIEDQRGLLFYRRQQRSSSFIDGLFFHRGPRRSSFSQKIKYVFFHRRAEGFSSFIEDQSGLFLLQKTTWHSFAEHQRGFFYRRLECFFFIEEPKVFCHKRSERSSFSQKF